MSTPQGPQDPYGPNPYADPVQEHVPEQGGDRTAGGQKSAYSGYPQGGSGTQQDNAYQQGVGYATGPTGYLQGVPVGFADAVRNAFSHIATFRGRASRSAFWWFALVAAIAWAVLGIIQGRSTIAGTIRGGTRCRSRRATAENVTWQVIRRAWARQTQRVSHPR